MVEKKTVSKSSFICLFVLFCILACINVFMFYNSKMQERQITEQKETIELLKDHVIQFTTYLFDGDMVGIRIYYFEDDGIFAHKHELEEIDKAIIQHNIREILKMTEPIDYYGTVFDFQSRDKYVGDKPKIPGK